MLSRVTINNLRLKLFKVCYNYKWAELITFNEKRNTIDRKIGENVFKIYLKNFEFRFKLYTMGKKFLSRSPAFDSKASIVGDIICNLHLFFQMNFTEIIIFFVIAGQDG